MLPKLFSLGKIVIYSYPLFMGLAWGVAYNISYKRFYREGLGKRFNEIFFGIFISSWLGAKILFLTTGHGVAGSANFWLGGGFVFYGGFFGALLFILCYTQFFKRVELKSLYLALPGAVFGHGVGRIGCFLAGCCYGTKTDCFLGITIAGISRHPVQLYEALGLFVLGIIILRIKDKRARTITTVYMAGYAVLRFLVEFFRGDEIRGVHGLLSTSQIISGVIIFVVLSYWVRIYGKNLYKKR